MVKYINADALREIWVWGKNDKYGYSECIPLKDLDDFPAADVRENEYSHKDWCPDGSKNLQCAECRAFVDLEDKYCHECGRILLSEG